MDSLEFPAETGGRLKAAAADESAVNASGVDTRAVVGDGRTALLLAAEGGSWRSETSKMDIRCDVGWSRRTAATVEACSLGREGVEGPELEPVAGQAPCDAELIAA